MDHRTLGRSGCSVSTLCLADGLRRRDRRAGGARTARRVVEAGGALVDTADVYSAGAAAEIVGRWLAARPAGARDRVLPATTGRFSMGDEQTALGNSRRRRGMGAGPAPARRPRLAR